MRWCGFNDGEQGLLRRSGEKSMRLIRPGVVAAFAGLAVAGAAPAPAPEQVVLTSAVLARTLDTRSAWVLAARQGPAVEDPGGNQAPGAITLCLRQGASGPCDPQLREALGATPVDTLFSAPHYLDEARVVGGRGASDQPLLLVRTASLHSGDGDQFVLTQALAYQRDADRFVRVYDHVTGKNNNQEVRYVEAGPLGGDIVSAEPTSDAPFGFWVAVDVPAPGSAYREALRYRSATHYGDGNALTVIDSEMPNIQRHLGVWRPGTPLPLPAGPCPRPRLVRMELWCG